MVNFSDTIFLMHIDLTKIVCPYTLLLQMQFTCLAVKQVVQTTMHTIKKLMKRVATFGIVNATDPLMQNMTR